MITMAIKQNLILKDENMNEEYSICGQNGVYKQADYKGNNVLLSEADRVGRFILIDLWQIGVFGSENCHAEWNDKEKVNIVTEENIDDFVNQAVDYITDGLFNTIKQEIIEEIINDEEETIKLIK